MNLTDFRFSLPEELIAQEPPSERGTSRMLVLDRVSGAVEHSVVARLADFLPSGAVLVFNDSKVRRARLHASSASGGKVELLLLRREAPKRWAAVTTRMAKQTSGKILDLPEDMRAEVIEVREDERLLEFSAEIDDDYLERNGHLPLPPYIKRADKSLDADRYQTVYAREQGSAAAPTAGLHFTQDILGSIKARGIEIQYVTLHVGLGTFWPVRVDVIEDHKMHSEEYTVSEETAAAVNKAKKEGRPVVAVGTTSLRTLESAWTADSLMAGDGSTNIFIYPGYRFNVVDSLFTNFHTPESTLMMLVSAFAGRGKIFAAYEEAIRERYKFFSYGDAMLIRSKGR